MAKRLYNPLDPTAVQDDPLGPAKPGTTAPSALGPSTPGAPTSTAPTVARAALVDNLAPNTPGQNFVTVPPTPPIIQPTEPRTPPPPPTTPTIRPLSDPTHQTDPAVIPPEPPPENGPIVEITPTDTPQRPTGPLVPPGPPPPETPPTPPIVPPIVPPSPTDTTPGAPTKPGIGPVTNMAKPDENGNVPTPTTPQATTNAAAHVVEGGTPEGITALYAKYHLHTPSADEIENWLNGTYGGGRTMAEVEAQIAASDEAQHAGGGGGGGGGRTDPNYVGSVVAQWMASNNPRGHQDAAYWTRRILETGGLGPDNMVYWQGRFTEPEGTHPAEGPSAPAAGPAAPAAPGVPGAGPSASMTISPYNQKLRDYMMSQLQGLSGSIDENNPELAPAIGAYNVQSQRDQQAERDQLAERAYARGDLSSGGFDTQISQGREAAAGKRANFSGSMVYQANVQRRQQLQAMLQTAVSAGLQDQAQAIQLKLAGVDEELRRLALSQQQSQFGDQLGFNYAQLIAELNRQSLLGGMNG